MSKQLNLEKRIRAMKRGESFFVSNKEARQAASQAAKTLYRAGVITFQIVTRKEGGSFKVAAI